MLKLKSVNFEQQEFSHHTLTQSYPGQLEWLIGRYTTCDLVLPSEEVSRVHGRIVFRDGHYHFTDAGSTSGSLLNGESLAIDELRPLKLGDLLQIGETYLQIEAIDPPDMTEAQPSDTLEVKLPALGHAWQTPEALTVRCCRIVSETPDVKSFSFVAEPPMLFDFLPGQFVNLEVEIDQKPVIRSYSIASSPTRPYHLTLSVKRESSPADQPDLPPGLVSNWLHDRLQVGDRLKLIGGAVGQFSCLPELPPKLLLISAGSGITPMMSMARWMQDTLINCDMLFVHSARTPKDIIFRSELEAMSAQMPNFRLAITLTQPVADQAWAGLTGRLSKSMLHLIAPDLRDRRVYVCGPNGFVETVKSLLEGLNFPMQNYYQESFGGAKVLPATQSVAQPVAQPVPAAAEAIGAKTRLHAVEGGRRMARVANGQSEPMPTAAPSAPSVYFAKSDRNVTADGNASVLELAELEGVPIRSACRVGACGACKVISRQGKVTYNGNPTALTPADQEAGYILCCIAQPADRLVVDA